MTGRFVGAISLRRNDRGEPSLGAHPEDPHAEPPLVLRRPADAAAADLAGRLATESVEPIDDVRSTAEYRRFALARVVRRMVLELAEPSPGGNP